MSHTGNYSTFINAKGNYKRKRKLFHLRLTIWNFVKDVNYCQTNIRLVMAKFLKWSTILIILVQYLLAQGIYF